MKEVSGRLPKLVAEMESKEVDAMLITNLTNIRYLTGFSGSAADLAILRKDDNWYGLITTDGRYALQIEKELTACGVSIDIEIGGVAKQSSDILKFVSCANKIAVESEHISLQRYTKLSASEEISTCELVPVAGLVESVRIVKDQGEIQRIGRASSIADQAFGKVCELLVKELSSSNKLSEADVAIELDYQMRLLGASESAFETIVAGGTNAAMPHHRADGSILTPGSTIVFDFGATYDGYRSDMTRTICVGEFSEPILEKMWNVVAESQSAGLLHVKAGATGKEIDQACREVIENAGWGDKFTHSTGHGVGLDIHEPPWISALHEVPVAENMILTVEPGVYIEELGGVRIEDTVVVASDGYKFLTNYPKVSNLQ